MINDNRKFYCYLDDFDLITIIIPSGHYLENTTYKLLGNDEVIDLEIRERVTLPGELKLVCGFDAYIELRMIYHVVSSTGDKSELYTGKIVRTELFDNIYYYKKTDLGPTYHKESTKFKVWTPVAKYVHLNLIYADGTTEMRAMLYTNAGVWRLVVEGDLEGVKYRYHVYVNGKEQVVTDPYATSSTANGDFSYVIDKEKTQLITHESPFKGNYLDSVIYEINVRDFSMDDSVPFANRGKYLGVIEPGLKTPSGNPAGLDYLKYLGITHVQLMPLIDFGGVDEINPDYRYNWGYNPEQYFVPEGWYASDPDDPYKRINELKMMVDGLHASGISVIMDVVYNHVYEATRFPFEKLVPGYAFNVDHDGIRTSFSGCKNDLATYRKMIRKLIIDSALFWAKEFKIDGFRFDLMGLIDFETMNELRQELHEHSDHLIVYGEGWRIHSSNQADRMAHMRNNNVLYTIGFFNDVFRETIKGNTFQPLEKGYATGNPDKYDLVAELMLGSARNRYLFKYTSQSVNYVECHDNMTFYDKAMQINRNEKLSKRQQKLATAMVILAQGIPFIHMGQEFYRTKMNEDNTFQAGDSINKIHYQAIDDNIRDINFIRELISLRKQHSCFKLRFHSELVQEAYTEALPSKTVIVSYKNKSGLLLVFKPLDLKESISVPPDYELLATSASSLEQTKDDVFLLRELGTYIFKKKGM